MSLKTFFWLFMFLLVFVYGVYFGDLALRIMVGIGTIFLLIVLVFRVSLLEEKQ